jgi:hypothetical protein
VGTIAFGLVAGGGRLVQFLLARRSWRRGRARALRGPAESAWREQTGFYPQLLDALRRRGAPKPSWSPPLHHAARLSQSDPGTSDTVADLASLFYEARFGGRRLTDPELAQADELVKALSAAPVPAESDA